MDIFVLVIQIALAAILAVAAVGKFMDLPGSRKAVNEFGVPKSYADPLGTALPFGELLLAVLLLFGPTARLGAFGAFVLFLAFIAGIGWNLRQGRTPDCHCFGELHSSPAGWHTVIRNGVFAIMALVVVIAGGVGPVETVENLSSAGRVGLWVTLLVVGLGVVMAWLLDRIAKQQDQLRTDIEALQTASLFAGLESSVVAQPAAVPAQEAASAAPPAEDPTGEPAPALDLPTLDGGRLTLDDIRAGGKPTLLLYTSPSCGFCSAMYPEVQEWGRRFGGDLGVAVIGRGEIEANREKFEGFDFPFAAVDESGDTAAAYDAVATPTGVIVMPNGTIVDPAAKGRPDIQKLVGRTLKRRQQQRAAVPATAPAPTPAPDEPAPAEHTDDAWPAPSFEVATPSGGTMSLDSLLARGKPVLMIFWSTGCGFCERFAPELGEWHRRFGDDVTIAVIADQGDPGIEEQAAQFGFTHVGLQEGRAVMSQYGGNGTPSAVLIQPDGWVESAAAQGAPMIRHLLGKVVNRSGRRPTRAAMPATPASNGTGDGATEDAEAQRETAIREALLASMKGPDLGTEGSRLPWQTLDGDYLGLDEYRGREVTLVFWGVDCEFSQRMLPDLREWEQEAGDAVENVIVISSGDVDANRQQGLRSRVVLDDAFATGNEFGVSGTPAAVRLDAEGRVASSLAVGSDAVLDLLYDLIDTPEPSLN